MPIIVIPIVATTALGLFFIYVIGKPISWVFEHLTDWLGGHDRVPARSCSARSSA